MSLRVDTHTHTHMYIYNCICYTMVYRISRARVVPSPTWVSASCWPTHLHCNHPDRETPRPYTFQCQYRQYQWRTSTSPPCATSAVRPRVVRGAGWSSPGRCARRRSGRSTAGRTHSAGRAGPGYRYRCQTPHRA